MINQIIAAELAYIKEFTQFTETNDLIVFSDPSLTGMDHHNFTYIKQDIASERLPHTIDSEVKRRQQEKHTSAFFISDFKLDTSLFKEYPYEIEFLEFIYMATPTATSKKLHPREDLTILPARSKAVLQDGIDVDIAANTIYMGDFAKDRIRRKVEIYSDKTMQTSLYVGYHKNTPIGNCELFIHDAIAKLEDFDILEAYQRQGFGTRFLKYLLEETEKNNVHQLYLVTDNADTAKDMYKKNHFETVGYKYEVYIDFKKPK